MATLAVAALAPLALLALAILGWVSGMDAVPLLSLAYDWPVRAALDWGVALSVLGVGGAYLYVMRAGERPLPPPEHGDLPSVLKALYL